MRSEDLKILRCIDCGEDVHLCRGEIEDDRISDAVLKCGGCARLYPVLNGVGIFFRSSVIADYLIEFERERLEALGFTEVLAEIMGMQGSGVTNQVKVAENWHFQHEEVARWEDYTGADQYHGAKMFWKFIPLDRRLIPDATVYLACVGRGKEIHHLLSEEPKRIIAAEIGGEVHSLPELFHDDRDKLLLLRCDVSHAPLKQGIADLVICDHALQHIEDHQQAFAEFSATLKPNGSISVCVYSWENNFLMTRIIEPLKVVFAKLPLRIVRLISVFPALVIFGLIVCVYRPLNRLVPAVARRLPLYEHMAFWGGNPFSFVWCACFDLIHAPISYHFREAEMKKLALANGLEVSRLVLTHGTTWSFVGSRR